MLTTWNSLFAFDRFVASAMNDVMTSVFAATSHVSYPVNVRGNESELVISLDVPGIKKEDIEVLVENRVLTIKGERKADYGENEKVWIGRNYGQFSRSFQLPEEVETDKLSAELADGVLTLRVPKHPSARPRRIQVGGSNTDAKQLFGKSE